MKKEHYKKAALITIAFIALTQLSIQYYYGINLAGVLLTGKGLSGIINIFVTGDTNRILIIEPENTTYNFDTGENYTMNLSVIANFTVNQWNYSLYDLRHETWITQNQAFTPNTTFEAVRFQNKLIINANHTTTGNWYQDEVVFTINTPNTAPRLGEINNPILICENESLNYPFNATDNDEDTLTADISPKNPFYTTKTGQYNETVTLFSIISGILQKNSVGTYEETISVNDNNEANCCTDNKETNITIIEINKPPQIENQGAQTVWTRGDNNTYYKEYQVTDEEDGNSNQGQLHFNISIQGGTLFTINNTHGTINYTPIEDEIGVYAIKVCVTDNELQNPHENISLCYPNNYTNNTKCDDFTLTVTNNNRAPQIINNTPTNNTQTLQGTTSITFYAEVYDPDGTIPDIDWYQNNNKIEHHENTSNDTYTYTAPCNYEGNINITILTTDGELNDSNTWTLTIQNRACTEETPPSGGGGGGGGEPYCTELWGCNDWKNCKNLQNALERKELTRTTYQQLKEQCNQEGYNTNNCGYQERICEDTKNCNNTETIIPTPTQQQTCKFTEDPQCNDGIQNCHDGLCEVLIDCGGPCEPCPTCNDGIQNQQEEGIDCGGPCENTCKPEQPSAYYNILLLLLMILLALIILITIRILWKYLAKKKDLERKRKRLLLGKFK